MNYWLSLIEKIAKSNNILEKFYMWIAWNVPKDLAMWCFVRVATANYNENSGERTCGDALDSWIK